jgi:plastocyanin
LTFVAGLLIGATLAWPGVAPAEPSPAAEAPHTLSPNDLVPEEEVLVRIHGRKFLPPTVRVHPGRKTRLVFRNEDAELHAFVPGSLFNGVSLSVEGNGAPEFGEEGFRKVIIPGDGVAELHFTLQKPGHYPFLCDMPGHEMRATIVVE